MRQLLQLIITVMPILTFANTEKGFGTIKGKVITNDDKVAQHVTVIITESNKGTVTDEYGIFEFSRLKEGNYTLQISLTDYETIEQTVTITENKITNVAFQLKLSNKQLQEVIVTSGQNKFAKKESDYVARMPLKNLENPQVYNVITSELLEMQGTVDYKTALTNAAGVSISGQNAAGRNFTWIRGFNVGNNVRNGLTSYQPSDIDIANIDRIEIIKGPTGTLFGGISNSYGAVVNRITKKPFDNSQTSISYTTGSYGFNRITADVNTPLKEDKSVLLRTNVALQTQDSWQDAGYLNTVFFAPGLIYKVDDKLSLSFDADIYQSKGTPSNLIFVGEIGGVDSFDDLGFDNKRSFNNNQLFNNNFVANAFAKAEYKLSPNWKSTTLINYGKTNQESIFPIATILSRNDVDVELGKFDYNITTQQIQQNLNGSFKLGSVNNRVLLGFDYLRNNTFLTQAYPGVFERVSLQGPRLSLTQQSAAAFFDGATVQNTEGKLQTYSAYVSDVIDVTNRLHVLLSLRLDHFNDEGEINYTTNESSGPFNQTSLAPRLGFSYEIVEDEFSVFGNYNSGFVNQQGVDLNGNSFIPEKASQIEGGLKWEAKSKIVNATLSYYNIDVENIVRSDINNPAFSVQNGNVMSRGMELDLAVNPFAGFNMMMGYAYNHSEITKGEPKVEGNRLSRNPEHQANFYTNYTFKNDLKGFSLGLGGNYGSETFTGDDNQFKLNSYKILNANVNYHTGKFNFGIKAENLTNEKYFSWNGQAYTQLRILGNLTLTF